MEETMTVDAQPDAKPDAKPDPRGPGFPFDPSAVYAVPVEALNEVVGILLSLPARDSLQALRMLEGVRTLDEYGIRP